MTVVRWREFTGHGSAHASRLRSGGVLLWRAKLSLRRYFFMAKVGQRRKKKERWKLSDGSDQFTSAQAQQEAITAKRVFYDTPESLH